MPVGYLSLAAGGEFEMWTMKSLDMRSRWNVTEMENCDDPGGCKQICQGTLDGKNLDGEIGKLSKSFMIPPTYHGKTNPWRNDLN